MVVSPDAGGVYRAKKFREGLAYRYGLDAGLAMIIKQRAKANEVNFTKQWALAKDDELYRVLVCLAFWITVRYGCLSCLR